MLWVGVQVPAVFLTFQQNASQLAGLSHPTHIYLLFIMYLAFMNLHIFIFIKNLTHILLYCNIL